MCFPQSLRKDASEYAAKITASNLEKLTTQTCQQVNSKGFDYSKKL